MAALLSRPACPAAHARRAAPRSRARARARGHGTAASRAPRILADGRRQYPRSRGQSGCASWTYGTAAPGPHDLFHDARLERRGAGRPATLVRRLAAHHDMSAPHRLAVALGVPPDYRDALGQIREVPARTLQTICAALGHPVADEAAAQAA